MRTISMITIFCLCNILLFAQKQTTKGTEFWFSYMENLSLAFNGPPSFSVMISSEISTSGQILVPYTGLSIPFTVNAMSDTEVFLPSGILYPQGDEAIIHFGFKVVTNDSVNVYVYHYRTCFTEATLVLPESELTSDYMITAQIDDRGLQPSEFIVEATQDSTDIQIIPSQITVSFRPPGIPFYITLNKGDVFQLQSFYNLAGTTVTALNSSKKLAIFSGTKQSALKCNSADDHLFDQNYMRMFGKEFVLVPMLNQGGDVFNILTLEDSNYVSINNNPPFLLATMGQFIDTVFSSPAYITSTKPICIAQYKKSQLCSSLGDPCMVIIPPINLLKYHGIFENDTTAPSITACWITSFYANVVIPTGTTLNLDGLPVTGFQTLTANPQYSWKQITLTVGPHHLYNAGGFNGFVYGVGFANGYAYHLGYDFSNSAQVALYSSDTAFCDKQSVNFFDLSTNNPTSWQWTFTGATPNSSTDQNPVGIYYPANGSFDVQLIACSTNGCDTLLLPNFIHEYPNPADSIWQSNDTLYSLPALSYQWYETTSGIIAGAINQYYVTTQPGSFYCIIADSIGCVATSNTIAITGLTPGPSPGEEWSIVIAPNPNDGNFEIICNGINSPNAEKGAELKIFDALGRVLFNQKLKTKNQKLSLEVGEGFYFIELNTGEKSFRQKFIVKN